MGNILLFSASGQIMSLMGIRALPCDVWSLWGGNKTANMLSRYSWRVAVSANLFSCIRLGSRGVVAYANWHEGRPLPSSATSRAWRSASTSCMGPKWRPANEQLQELSGERPPDGQRRRMHSPVGEKRDGCFSCDSAKHQPKQDNRAQQHQQRKQKWLPSADKSWDNFPCPHYTFGI